MTRKELKKVRDLENEIRMWKRRLCELQQSSIVGSPNLNGTGGSSAPSSAVERRAIRIAEMCEIVSELKAQAEEERIRVLQHILTIEDPLLRQIVSLRCVECMSWKKVARYTHQSEENAQMILYRAYPI